jgi:hypothetical protein
LRLGLCSKSVSVWSATGMSDGVHSFDNRGEATMLVDRPFLVLGLATLLFWVCFAWLLVHMLS